MLILLAGGAWWLLGNRSRADRHAIASNQRRRPKPGISRSWCCRSPISPTIPRQDYFADGVTENLTTDLSRLRGTFVIARNTAFTFKGKNVDAKEIGKELGVRYVLEGSVQRDAGRVRVNVQLIDAETGKHLWADRFDKALADLFEMQDEIVARLANQLGTELIAAEARRAHKRRIPIRWTSIFRVWHGSTGGSTSKTWRRRAAFLSAP